MSEVKTQVVASTNQHTGREVLFFIESKTSCIGANWHWNLHAESLFCSDVMWTSETDHHTKVLLHPDDKAAVKKALAELEKGKEFKIQLRVITSYGEVVTLKATGPFSFSMSESIPVTADAATAWAEKRWLQRQLEETSLQFKSYHHAEEVNGLGHWWFNSVTSEVWYSDGVFRLFKIPAQSLNSHLLTFQSFIHPDDRAIVTEIKAEAIEQQLPFQMEYRVVCSNGTESQLREFCRWEFNEQGQHVLYGSFFLLNETAALEQKAQAAIEELAMERRKLRLAEENTGIGIFEVNLYTRQASFSDSFYRLLGLKPGSKPPGVQTLFDHVHPDDRAEVQKTVITDFAIHQITEITFRLARPDGKVRTVRRKGRVLTNENGQPIAIGMLQDITRQLVFEKELDKIKTDVRLLRLGQHLQDAATNSATWYWNLADNTVRTNEYLWQLLGGKPDATGFSWQVFLRFVSEEDRLSVQECLKAATKSTKEQKCRFRLLRKGEQRHFEAVLQQQVDEKASWLMVSLRDVTETYHLQKTVDAKEKFAQSLADNTVNHILVSDVNHQIQLWNRAFEETFGIPRTKAIGKNLFEIFPALQNETIIADLNKALAGETVMREGYRLVGTKEIVNILFSPIHNDEGTITGVLQVLQNTSREFHLREQLTQRLAFIENLLEHSVDRIIVLDRNLNYQYWNRRAEEYYGISRDEVIGRNLLELFPAFATDPSYPELRRVLRGETVYIPAQETLAEKKVYYETYLVPLKTEMSDVSGIMWIVHDLTKEYHLQEVQKLAQRQLEAEHRRLKEAQAIGRVGSFEWTVGDAVTYWSDELYRINGLEPQSEEITIEKVNRSIHPDDFERVENLKQASLLIPGDYKIIHRILMRNGEVRWVNHQWESIANEEGKMIRVSGVVQDITDEVEANQRIQQSESLLRSTETVAALGSYEADLAPNTLRFSDGMYHLFGEEPSSFEPSLEWIDSRSHPDDIAPVKEVLDTAIANKQPYHYTRRIYRKDGELRTLEAYGRVISDAAGNAIKLLGLVQDITQRKKAQEEILRLKDEIAKRATDKYRSLFNAIDQGFEVVEMVYNEAGDPVDFLFIETNPAFEQQTGIKNVAGKKGREVGSNIETYWLEAFDQVVKTGEPVRYENYNQDTKGWFSVYAFRVGNEGSTQLAVIFTNITERKQREKEQALLLKLGDSIRPLTDPVAIEGEITSILREHFDAGWCYYVEWDEANKIGVVRRDAARQGLPSLVGRHDVSDVPEYFELIKAKHVVNVSDYENFKLLTPEIRQRYIALGFRSMTMATLVKQDRLVASLLVGDNKIRQWSKHEETLLMQVAERTWAAVERAKAEEALRQSEQRLRKTISIETVGILFFRLDGSMTECNNAFTRMLGYSCEELRTVDWKVMTPEEFMDVTTKAATELAATGETAPYEKEMIRKDGSRFWALCAPRRLSGEGKDSECFEFIADITNTKAAQEEVARNLSDTLLLRDLSETLVSKKEIQALYNEILDTAIKITKADAGTLQLLDEETMELVVTAHNGFTKEMVDYFYRVDASSTTSCGIALTNNQRVYVDFDEPGIADSDGSLKRHVDEGYLSAQSTPLIAHSGKIVGMVSTHWRQQQHRTTDHEAGFLDLLSRQAADFIEQKHAEVALQKSEEKYRTLFESVDDAFVIIELIYDDTGKPVDFIYRENNPAFLKHVGMDLREKRRSELSLDKKDFLLEKYEYVITTGQPVHFEYSVQSLGGQWFEATATRIGEESGKLIGVIFRNVTERKKAEEQLKDFASTMEREVQLRTSELKESKEFEQAITATIPDIVTIVDNATGKVEYANLDAVEQAGFDYEQLFAAPSEERRKLLHPDDLGGVKKYYERFVSLSDTEENEVEYRVKNKRGEWIWLSIKGRVFKRDEKGVATHSLHICRNVTAAKIADVELRKNLTLLEQAEELAQIGSWEYNISNGAFTWSEGMYRMFNLPQGMGIRPETYLDFAMEEDRSVAKRIVKNLKKTHKSFEETMQIRRSDGPRLLRIKGSVVNDESGTPQKIVGVDLDITDIKEAEERLAETRHWLKQTAEASPDAITIYNLINKKPVYLNNCLAEWTGKTLDELVNMGIEGRLRLIHADDRLRLLHFNEKLSMAKDGDVLNLEYRIYTKDGDERWIRNRSKVFNRDATGKVTQTLSILQDISEEKAAERLLKSMNTSLKGRTKNWKQRMMRSLRLHL